MIHDALASFEAYHNAIYKMETRLLIESPQDMDTAEYQELVSGLDRIRTTCHNEVILNLSVLNRLAMRENLPLIYDGIVSEDRPYRREVANAILQYAEGVIQGRR